MAESLPQITPEEAREMERFALDPAIESDVREWEATAPLSDDAVTDYSHDAFEFGGQAD